VQEFLLFAEQHRGYTFEQTLELFLAALGERVGIKPWQIQQAADVKAFLTRLAMVDKVSASTQNQAFRPP